MSKLLVVGLMGGVGSGKSTVARLFAEHGAVVLDADALAHAALRRPEVKEEIVAAFGDGALDPAGEIDRPALAAVVFSDASRKRTLEEIVHPRVRGDVERELARLAAADGPPRIVVLDVPLLLESPLDRLCDTRAFVDTPREVREERVRTTRGWDADELARREKNQMPIERKKAAAEYMIENVGSLESTRARVGAIHEELLSQLDARPPGGGSVSRSNPSSSPPNEG